MMYFVVCFGTFEDHLVKISISRLSMLGELPAVIDLIFFHIINIV